MNFLPTTTFSDLADLTTFFERCKFGWLGTIVATALATAALMWILLDSVASHRSVRGASRFIRKRSCHHLVIVDFARESHNLSEASPWPLATHLHGAGSRHPPNICTRAKGMACACPFVPSACHGSRYCPFCCRRCCHHS